VSPVLVEIAGVSVRIVSVLLVYSREDQVGLRCYVDARSVVSIAEGCGSKCA